MIAFFSNGRIKPPELRTAGAIVVLLACAAAPPWVLHQAFAATAGTLFEAAPFVLAVALARGPLVRPLAALLGCGCGGGAGAAALSLSATALCWTIFGPWVALARFGAAIALRALEHDDAARPGEGDVLDALARIALPAFALALGTDMALAAHLRSPFPAGFTSALAFGAGLLAGSVAPCTTAAVAAAGMLRGAAPGAAAGILVAAGLVPALPLWIRDTEEGSHSARFGLALVALACLALALRGGAGLVHPRLVPLLWLAVPAGLAALRRTRFTRSRMGLAAPAIMLAGLLAGSPPPPLATATTMLDDVYPGQPVAFTGQASSRRGHIDLVRYAITCCRADATAIAAPTDIGGHVPEGTWLAIVGTIARGRDGDYVRVRSWRRIAAPLDPYTYR